MSFISFRAHGRKACVAFCGDLTSGSVGLPIKFEFDSTWDGLQKTAIFKGSGTTVDVVLTGDTAAVPAEVMEDSGLSLKVGVWGADPDGNVVIPTVWVEVGKIKPGAEPSGIDPHPPAPSWAAQVQEISLNALNTANSVREDADAGEFDGATYTPAVSAGGDLSWTNDKDKPNPPTVNIKGPEGQPGQTGATPDISIGTVETLQPGSPATVTITGTAENPVLSFGIPQGQQGAPGEVTQAEFDDLADEVSQQKSAIDDLSALVDRKAGMLVDTASGAIASFVPDATIPNLLGVSVDIEPVQDLHGYDHPWPAGGNINKLDPTVSYGGLTYNPAVGRVFTPTVSAKKWTDNGDGTFSNTLVSWEQAGFVIGPLPSGAVYFSFASATGGLRISVFVMDSEYAVNRVSLNRNPITEGDAVSVNTTFSGTDTYLGVYIGGAAQAATISQPYVYTGADASIRTYYPYSNECPISGWNSVEVEATGVNLFDKAKTTHLYCDGTMTLRENSDMLSVFVELVQGATYTFTQTSVGAFTRYAVCDSLEGRAPFYNPRNGTAQTFITDPQFTFTANRKYLICTIYRASADVGKTFDDFADTCQLTVGSTAHAYHPYAGNRYTIALGQTVYGAKLTIAEDGSVKALIDRAMVDLGTLGYLKSSFVQNGFVATSGMPDDFPLAPGSSAIPNWICSNYGNIVSNIAIESASVDYALAWRISAQNKGVIVKDSNYAGYYTNNDMASFKAAMSGVQLVYELATPIEIQLDPVTIAAIAGQQNSVWADAGDVAVTYAADIKAYIDRLNQPTEDDMIANTLIAANKYFTINNRLFLSTASIAAGAMIIPGTNCQETSLAAALNALNA